MKYVIEISGDVIVKFRSQFKDQQGDFKKTDSSADRPVKNVIRTEIGRVRNRYEFWKCTE